MILYRATALQPGDRGKFHLKKGKKKRKEWFKITAHSQGPGSATSASYLEILRGSIALQVESVLLPGAAFGVGADEEDLVGPGCH